MPLKDQLVHARTLSGYSQDDVGAALGVSRAMVSYWESGKRQPNDRQLAALARLYRFSIEDLLGESDLALQEDLGRLLFRAAEAELPVVALPGLREFADFLDNYAELAEAVDFDMHGLKQSPFAIGHGFESADDARRKAEEVRAYLRLGLGPIGDMDLVCELLGITVFKAALGADLGATVSGAFFNHPDVGFAVLVNVEMAPGRRRFTIAHELSHALFDSKRAKYVLSLPQKDPRERFADAFAAEFLMPTEGIRRVMEEHSIGPRIDDPADVIYLQRFFKVSHATALVRLRQARLITHKRYEELKRLRPVLYARALGYEIDKDEYSQDPELWRLRRFPQRFLRLVRRAIQREVISVPSAAHLTGLSVDELTDLVSEQVSEMASDSLELAQFEVTGVPDR